MSVQVRGALGVVIATNATKCEARAFLWVAKEILNVSPQNNGLQGGRQSSEILSSEERAERTAETFVDMTPKSRVSVEAIRAVCANKSRASVTFGEKGRMQSIDMRITFRLTVEHS